jgi:hypothetical protein
MLCEEIGGEPGKPAIAIRVGVDLRKPVMKSQCDLVGGICVVLDPVSHIIQHLSQIKRDPKAVGSDPSVGLLRVVARPSP